MINNMNVGIVSCGKGNRINEKTVLKPKPMIEICGKPISFGIL